MPGIGLILLRLGVAVGTILEGICGLIGSSEPTPALWAIGLLECVVGLALLIGFLTPIAGFFAMIGNAEIGFSLILRLGAIADARIVNAIYLAVMSLALILLGPGAFSLDARLFGRREIIIPESRRPR